LEILTVSKDDVITTLNNDFSDPAQTDMEYSQNDRYKFISVSLQVEQIIKDYIPPPYRPYLLSIENPQEKA
jgi:hypothetical protein